MIAEFKVTPKNIQESESHACPLKSIVQSFSERKRSAKG
jgi:hypothetical protein